MIEFVWSSLPNILPSAVILKWCHAACHWISHGDLWEIFQIKKKYIYFDTHVKKRSPRHDLWESVLHTGPDAVTRSIWFWFLRVTWCFFYCPPKNVAQSRVRENEREIAKQASSVHWCGLLKSILIESAQSKAPGPTLAHQRFGIWPKTSMKMML